MRRYSHALAVFAVAEAACVEIVAVYARRLLLTGVVRVGRDAASPELGRHLAQRFVDMPRQNSQALCRDERVTVDTRFFERDGDILRRIRIFHSSNDLGFIEYKPAAAKSCGAFFAELFVAQIKVAFRHLVARRNV